MKNQLKITLVALVSLSFASCSDNFLEPTVDYAVPTSTAISSAADMAAVINGAHDLANGAGTFGEDAIGTPEVMSDNAFANTNSGRYAVQSLFSIVSTDGYPSAIWSGAYAAIAQANIVINSGLSGGDADHYLGQAYSIRAFMHFFLLKNFGQQYVDGGDASLGIPIVTTYADGNLFPARDSYSAVISQVEQDFDMAMSLLDPSKEVTNLVSYYSTAGFMSRFYNFSGNFSEAIAAADIVINSGLYSVEPAENVVPIWQSTTSPGVMKELVFTSTDRNAFENLARMMRDTNYGDIEVTQDLYDSYSDTDVRKELLVEDPVGVYRMVNKFNLEDGTDAIPMLRYAEVWLNKAEALARSGQNAQALEMIQTLSEARNATNNYTSGSALEVLEERRLELALEGHRFYDLARHGLDIRNVPLPASLASTRFNSNNGDIEFGDYRYAFPIPQNEMDSNPQMVQNKGY